MTTYITELPANIIASMVGEVLANEGIAVSSQAKTKVAVILARILTKRATDECDNHEFIAKTTGFDFCPQCGLPLSTHR